jgi:formamidopyrimidine-DNA glycosylase
MPELPEVENLRLGLESKLIGQKILKVKVRKPKLVSGKGTLRTASNKKVKEFEAGLTGETFYKIERRAKNLIFKFKSGKILLVHLKMSGQFVYKGKKDDKKIIGGHPIEISEKELPNKHTHVLFELNKGNLYYNDTRMFGYLLFYPTQNHFEKDEHFKLLGLEPTDKNFTAKYLEESLKKKTGKIKAVLMNQEIVTGLGNIYADESLFESKIRPTRKADSLKKEEVSLLYKAIIRIIKRAILVGGSSVATYRLLDESMGNYAREHKVYGKSGEKCPKCSTLLTTTTVQTRTTVFCTSCQK